MDLLRAEIDSLDEQSVSTYFNTHTPLEYDTLSVHEGIICYISARIIVRHRHSKSTNKHYILKCFKCTYE